MSVADLTDPTTATLAIAAALEAVGIRAAVYEITDHDVSGRFRGVIGRATRD